MPYNKSLIDQASKVKSKALCLVLEFLVAFAAKGPGFEEMEACFLLVNLRKGMQSSSEQPLVGRSIA